MKSIEEKLEQMNKVTPDLPLHRAHLRRALLASKQFEGSTYYDFMIRLLPVTLLLALVFGLSFTLRPQNSDSPLAIPTASAQELVTDAISKLQTLTPEELQALEEKIGADEIFTYLLSAQSASDLAYVSAENLTCENSTALQQEQKLTVSMNFIPEEPFETTIENEDGSFTTTSFNYIYDPYDPVNCKNPLLLKAVSGENMAILDDYGRAWNALTYVGFTDQEGHNTILGLEDDLMPGFMMDFSDDETNVTIQATEESGGDTVDSFFQGEAN